MSQAGPLRRAGLVCRDDFQPGISINNYSTKNVSDDVDHLSPEIWCFIFFTYAAAWAALPLHPILKEKY